MADAVMGPKEAVAYIRQAGVNVTIRSLQYMRTGIARGGPPFSKIKTSAIGRIGYRRVDLDRWIDAQRQPA